MNEYIVTCRSYEDLEDLYDDMETPGGSLYIPDRAVDLVHRREISRNTHYMLTEEEAAVFHPEIRDYGCEAVPNIFIWKPNEGDSVCYNLDVRIGSTCSENAELFQVMIVSPEYIRDPDSREVLEKWGKYLVVPNYSWDACESLLNHLVEKISGASWEEVKQSLAQYFDVG